MSNSRRDYPLIRFVLGAVALLTVYGAYYFVLRKPPAWLHALLSDGMVVPMSACGQFGDMFGALNAFVSAFVLVFVIITFLLERKKFEQTKDEYRYQIQPLIDFKISKAEIKFPSVSSSNQLLLIPRINFSYTIKNITDAVPVNVFGEVYLSRLSKRASVGKVVGGSGMMYPRDGESVHVDKFVDLSPIAVSDVLSDLTAGGDALTFHFDFIYKNVLGGSFRIQRSLVVSIAEAYERSRVDGIVKMPRHPSEGMIIQKWKKTGFSSDFVSFAQSQLGAVPSMHISTRLCVGIDATYFAVEPIASDMYEELRAQFMSI